MKESRISNSSPDHKRPGWNSKTKIIGSPIKTQSPPPHDKTKTKPPIPKLHKSPSHKPSEIRSASSEKKIAGGSKVSRAENTEEAKEVKEMAQKLNETDGSSERKEDPKEPASSRKSYKF